MGSSLSTLTGGEDDDKEPTQRPLVNGHAMGTRNRKRSPSDLSLKKSPIVSADISDDEDEYVSINGSPHCSPRKNSTSPRRSPRIIRCSPRRSPRKVQSVATSTLDLSPIKNAVRCSPSKKDQSPKIKHVPRPKTKPKFNLSVGEEVNVVDVPVAGSPDHDYCRSVPGHHEPATVSNQVTTTANGNVSRSNSVSSMVSSLSNSVNDNFPNDLTKTPPTISPALDRSVVQWMVSSDNELLDKIIVKPDQSKWTQSAPKEQQVPLSVLSKATSSVPTNSGPSVNVSMEQESDPIPSVSSSSNQEPPPPPPTATQPQVSSSSSGHPQPAPAVVKPPVVNPLIEYHSTLLETEFGLTGIESDIIAPQSSAPPMNLLNINGVAYVPLASVNQVYRNSCLFVSDQLPPFHQEPPFPHQSPTSTTYGHVSSIGSSASRPNSGGGHHNYIRNLAYSRYGHGYTSDDCPMTGHPLRRKTMPPSTPIDDHHHRMSDEESFIGHLMAVKRKLSTSNSHFQSSSSNGQDGSSNGNSSTNGRKRPRKEKKCLPLVSKTRGPIRPPIKLREEMGYHHPNPLTPTHSRLITKVARKSPATSIQRHLNRRKEQRKQQRSESGSSTNSSEYAVEEKYGIVYEDKKERKRRLDREWQRMKRGKMRDGKDHGTSTLPKQSIKEESRPSNLDETIRLVAKGKHSALLKKYQGKREETNVRVRNRTLKRSIKKSSPTKVKREMTKEERAILLARMEWAREGKRKRRERENLSTANGQSSNGPSPSSSGVNSSNIKSVKGSLPPNCYVSRGGVLKQYSRGPYKKRDSVGSGKKKASGNGVPIAKTDPVKSKSDQNKININPVKPSNNGVRSPTNPVKPSTSTVRPSPNPVKPPIKPSYVIEKKEKLTLFEAFNAAGRVTKTRSSGKKTRSSRTYGTTAESLF